jgi:hypothetical protein
MRNLALACLVVGCGGGDGGDGTTDGTTAAASTTTGTADTSTAGASMSSTTAAPGCDVPPEDCTTCWECATAGACKDTYDACASNFECAGSLACAGYMCPPDGLQQECLDHCCQNCAEHLMCPLVDAVVTCVEQQCADLCGPATCTG